MDVSSAIALLMILLPLTTPPPYSSVGSRDFGGEYFSVDVIVENLTSADDKVIYSIEISICNNIDKALALYVFNKPKILVVAPNNTVYAIQVIDLSDVIFINPNERLSVLKTTFIVPKGYRVVVKFDESYLRARPLTTILAEIKDLLGKGKIAGSEAAPKPVSTLPPKTKTVYGSAGTESRYIASSTRANTSITTSSTSKGGGIKPVYIDTLIAVASVAAAILLSKLIVKLISQRRSRL